MTQSTYEQFFPRSNNHIGEIADFLYKEVLLYCESDEIAKLKGANITSNSLTKSINGRIMLDYNSHVVRSLGKKPYLSNSINLQKLNNEIHFTTTGNKLISLMGHIRNSFAHNLVVIDNNDVVLGDFLTYRNGINFAKPTMLGRLSIADLKFLISQAKSLSK